MIRVCGQVRVGVGYRGADIDGGGKCARFAWSSGNTTGHMAMPSMHQLVDEANLDSNPILYRRTIDDFAVYAN